MMAWAVRRALRQLLGYRALFSRTNERVAAHRD